MSLDTEAVVQAEKKEGDNTRGIPPAKFIEDVPSFVTATKIGAEGILKQLHTLYGKYKFMESQLVSQQKGLLTKIPDITNALNALQYLMKKRDAPVSTHFELADSLYANAKIQNENKVCLWLGANVMLEYEYKEAEELLTKNLKNAQITLDSLELDLAFLKDQITVSEVNIARVHNYKVQLKGNEPKPMTTAQ